MAYFVGRLTPMSIEGKISNAVGHLFGMVMQADFLRFFLDSGRMQKLTGTKVDICIYVFSYLLLVL